jgi:dipeptide/tripeptide permease
MNIYPNHTKQQLEAGKIAIGMGLHQSRTTDIGAIAKTCGYDWLFIDMEHSALDIGTASQIASAALPVGISLANEAGRSAFFWLFLSYVLQSIGELLISPIGYAMIGKLAPRQYQGVMMGSWMMVTGLASLFAGDFSGMIPEPSGTTAIVTNPDYSRLFANLGWASTVVGIAMVLLIPFLRRLIRVAEPARD